MSPIHSDRLVTGQSSNWLSLSPIGASLKEKTEKNITITQDQADATGQITYDIGPLSLGYGWSGLVTGYENSTNAGYYKSHMYGIAFNINDDLSVSYGYHDSRMEDLSNDAGSLHEEGNRYVEVSSLQAAYSMGGASIRLATIDADNVGFSSAASADQEATVMSVSLAF